MRAVGNFWDEEDLRLVACTDLRVVVIFNNSDDNKGEKNGSFQATIYLFYPYKKNASIHHKQWRFISGWIPFSMPTYDDASTTRDAGSQLVAQFCERVLRHMYV